MVALLIIGTPVTLKIGLIGGVVALFIGSILGLISGYFGGVLDTITRSVVDVGLTIPAMAIFNYDCSFFPRCYTDDDGDGGRVGILDASYACDSIASIKLERAQFCLSC